MIYLDNAATTEMCKAAQMAQKNMARVYGNAHSLNRIGAEARDILSNARLEIADRLNAADQDSVFFTSGATEGNNWAIKGTAFYWLKKNKTKCHVITQKTEHHSVLNPCKWLEEIGIADVTYLGVDGNGLVNPDDVRRAIRPNTALISIMMVNNETGVKQPVEEIGWIADEHLIFYHVDATQALGKMEVNVKEIGCDMLTASGHKFHAGKGCGIAYRAFDMPLDNLLHGGEQQLGMRPGTDDVLAAVRMQEALRWCYETAEPRMIPRLTKRILSWAHERGVRVNGKPDVNAGIVSLRMDGSHSEEMLVLLEKLGVTCSSGAACTTGTNEPSHVLKAMGVPYTGLEGTIRISVGKLNTMEEVNEALRILDKARGML